MELLSIPANRKIAYFCDEKGENMFQFMFAPHTLRFVESQEFNQRVLTGSDEADVLWVSGRPKSFPLNIFVDRTPESGGSNQHLDLWENKKSAFQLMPSFQQRIRSILAETKAAFKGRDTQFNFVPSDLNVSPHYEQNTTANEKFGVGPDLERLLYFNRQKGATASSVVVRNAQDINTNISQYNKKNPKLKFVAPPICRFFYGNIWREGYIDNVDYTLSAPNSELICRRLEATLDFIWVRGGTLQETSTPAYSQNLSDQTKNYKQPSYLRT